MIENISLIVFPLLTAVSTGVLDVEIVGGRAKLRFADGTVISINRLRLPRDLDMSDATAVVEAIKACVVATASA